jgi:hypothetical protein
LCVGGSPLSSISGRFQIEEITMKKFAVAAALAFVTMLTPLYAAPPSSTLTQIPVVGTVLTGGTFNGTFNLTRFATTDGALTAVGTLTGTVTTTAGQTTSMMQTVAVPVSTVTGTCNILHLDLGPLSLNLLGLQIDLSEIVLDITAQAGAGNLLGNLLCGVANLLNNPSGLADLLNRILALL